MNEELDLLKHWKTNSEYGVVYIPDFVVNKIEQALLKAQEQDFNYKNIVIPFFEELVELLGITDTDEMLDKIKELKKALKIIFEKSVDIEFLKSADTFDEYNKLVKIANVFSIPLIKKEFDSLKEMTDNA